MKHKLVFGLDRRQNAVVIFQALFRVIPCSEELVLEGEGEFLLPLVFRCI